MTSLGKCLIVDDSRLVREMLAENLRPHCSAVLLAGGGREAIAMLLAHKDIELIISDVHMADGDGFSIIDSLPAPRPFFVLCTGRPSVEIAARAEESGVVLLPKPLIIGEMLRLLGKQKVGKIRLLQERAPRTRLLARVFVLDADGDLAPLLRNELRDVSASGALIETAGPIEVGTQLHLGIELQGLRAEVQAKVVRVQEPQWGSPGGVGVQFQSLSAAAAATIATMVERHGLANEWEALPQC